MDINIEKLTEEDIEKVSKDFKKLLDNSLISEALEEVED